MSEGLLCKKCSCVEADHYTTRSEKKGCAGVEKRKVRFGGNGRWTRKCLCSGFVLRK